MAIPEKPCTSSAAMYCWARSRSAAPRSTRATYGRVGDRQRERRPRSGRRRTRPRPAPPAGCRGTRTARPARPTTTVSNQPPLQAVAIGQRRAQRRSQMVTTASGPSIDVRAPTSIRESRSRPLPSKPSRWPPVGPTKGRRGSTAVGVVRRQQRCRRSPTHSGDHDDRDATRSRSRRCRAGRAAAGDAAGDRLPVAVTCSLGPRSRA